MSATCWDPEVFPAMQVCEPLVCVASLPQGSCYSISSGGDQFKVQALSFGSTSRDDADGV